MQARAGLGEAATWILAGPWGDPEGVHGDRRRRGSLEDVYRYHGIDTDSIARAALDLAT